MNDKTDKLSTDKLILSLRSKKNEVDPQKPYGWLVEKERTIKGTIENTGIIFLTNRECTFHCLMCDLWKNTTDFTVAPGAIPNQIRYALSQMPSVRHLKLYNSGSFFDPGAIPESDYEEIASILSTFETIIVECHPRLINEKCLKFRDMLAPELHIAMGLETVNPDILRNLNKKMTLADFSKSVSFLKKNLIPVRAFILLRPPLLSEEEGIFWAERSIDYAFEAGVECCTIIPVRAGNGIMDKMLQEGDFNLPDVHSLEKVLEYGIGLNRGRVFADTWDLGLFSKCHECTGRRTERISNINLKQKILVPVECSCNHQEYKNQF